MFSKLLASIFNDPGETSSGTPDAGTESPAATPKPSEAEVPLEALTTHSVSFDHIYQNAAVKLPAIQYGIAKLIAMTDSSHLAGMTPEVKRCAVLMALDAAGAPIEEVLQDAVMRQRVLHDYEEKHIAQLQEFESRKCDENRAIQAELDEITAKYISRIQTNIDQLAQQQDAFQAWQKRKQQECQRMADVAAFLVPSQTSNSSHLSAVLERASAARSR